MEKDIFWDIIVVVNEIQSLIVIKEKGSASETALNFAKKILDQVKHGEDVNLDDVFNMVKAGGVAGRIEIMMENNGKSKNL